MSKATDWRVGVSSASYEDRTNGFLPREMFEAYREGGIDCLEISVSDGCEKQIDFKKTVQLSKEYGIELWSYHLPFMSIDVADLDKDERERAFNYQAEIIKKVGDIGIKTFVLHPSGEPCTKEERLERIKVAKDTIAKLACVAGEVGSIIAVEDLPRTCLGNCSSEIKELISVDDRLKVCFDTNHLLIESNADFIKAVGDRIHTLHVSDYDFLNEQHWMPYEGDIDWVELVSLLEKVNYKGPFMYELRLNPPATGTINRRKFTYADFRENYLALINKKPAKAIGVKNPEALEKRAYFKTKQF